MAISNELVNLANSLVAVKEACNEALEAKGVSAVNCLDEIADAISDIEGGGFEEPTFYMEFDKNGNAIYIKLGDRANPYATASNLNKFTDAFNLIADTDVVLYVNVRGNSAMYFVDNLSNLIEDFGIDVDRLTVYGAYKLVNKVYYWGEINVPDSIEAHEIVWKEGSKDDDVATASEDGE